MSAEIDHRKPVRDIRNLVKARKREKKTEMARIRLSLQKFKFFKDFCLDRELTQEEALIYALTLAKKVEETEHVQWNKPSVVWG